MATDIPPILIEFQGDIKGIKDAITKVQNDLTKFDKSAEKSGNSAKTLSAKTVAAGAVMAHVFEKVGESVLKFGEGFVTTYTDIGREVRGMQRVLGGSAEDMSRLRFAAEEVGVSAQDLTIGVRILSKHLTANDDAAKALGISYRDSKGNLLPFTDVLAKISDKFVSMPNGMDKTAMAVRTFGRSATVLLPLLNQGSKGLEDFYANADKLGLTLSGKDLEAVKDYTLKQREMHAAVQGLQLAVGRDLVPQLSKLAGFVMTNVVPQLQSFVNGLLGNKGLIGASGKAGEAAHTWGSRLRGLIGVIKGMKDELVILGGIMAGIFVAKKIFNGINAIVGVVKALKVANQVATIATQTLAVAEGEASAGGFVKAYTYITTAIQSLFGATAAEAAATDVMAGGAVAAATAVGTETVAMEGLTVASTEAAAAEAAVALGEDVVTGGTAAVAQLAGIAAFGAVAIGIGVAANKIIGMFTSAENAPASATTTPPDGGGDGNAPPKPPKPPKPPAGTPDQTLAQSLAEQVRQRTAIRRLKSMGASQGLIDALISSNDWEKEYGKIVRGGQATLNSLQNVFNKTDAGTAEIFTKAHKKHIGKITAEATKDYRKFGVDLSKQAKTEGKVGVVTAYLKSLKPLLDAARAEEKATRNTDMHGQAATALNKILGEQATAQKKLNDLTNKSTKAIQDQTSATVGLANAQSMQNTSWLAAHGVMANASNQGTVTVPVVIDGHEVFRVVQKYSNQNNRRNITTGIGLSGAVI